MDILCDSNDCNNVAKYYCKNTLKRYCSTHKTSDMIYKHFRKICKYDGCNRYAYFNIKDSPPLYCSTHKTSDMISKDNVKCIHNKYKPHCKDCKSGSICEHDRVRSRCTICGTTSFCIHNRLKNRCTECQGNDICKHKKRKSRCIKCGGASICEHNKERIYCKDCKGSQICKHNKRYIYCKECDGSYLCKSEWCTSTGNKKYNMYCVFCAINLFPDMPICRNYKTKEKAVNDYILSNFPIEKYSWISDKKIMDGCSQKRPDLLLDLGYQVIIVEIDENQHQNYEEICENKRIMHLSQDINHRPMILIRFNPDCYIKDNTKITSCWSINKSGICMVKKSKSKEWDERLEKLYNTINYWCDETHISDKTINKVELFYDS